LIFLKSFDHISHDNAWFFGSRAVYIESSFAHTDSCLLLFASITTLLQEIVYFKRTILYTLGCAMTAVAWQTVVGTTATAIVASSGIIVALLHNLFDLGFLYSLILNSTRHGQLGLRCGGYILFLGS